MGMGRTAVNPKIGHLLTLEGSTGKHALYSRFKDPLGELAIKDLVRLALLDTAGETGVPVVGLILALGAAERDLFAVDDDDVVATVHGGGEGWLVLAAQAIGDDGGQAADNQSFCVDQHPIFHDVLGFRRIGAHAFSLGY